MSYPDTVSPVQSTSIQFHRTSRGRFSQRVRVSEDIAEPDLSPGNGNEPGTSSTASTEEPPAEPPWSDDFFANEAFISNDPTGVLHTQSGPHGTATSFLEDYLIYRQSILDELILQDGRMGASACSECLASDMLYQCQDCFHPRLRCRSCILEAHPHLPLHCLLRWDDGYFTECSLRSLGMVISLNHGGD
ncbi:hypothetical protein BDN71DRAFT_1513095 [Pleurotus eryngii]|uniref:Uncharacterized protein n=1 Tax=Pleurotus eryngii TaxID=5323 RepID=A0A9P6D153_PLEER|nr:hypothetical protein BDN71DRAFT_1513095 [Pleurotus eryngii]